MGFAGFNSFACKCGQTLFDAWSTFVESSTAFAVQSFVVKTGQPDTSELMFTVSDVVVEPAAHLFSMALGKRVYMVLQSDPLFGDPGFLSVASYDVDTGENYWEDRSTNVVDTLVQKRSGFYVWGMAYPGEGNQFCCNDTQVWSMDTNEIFSSDGILPTVAPNSGNTVVQPYEGESVEPVSVLHSSHDFPKVLTRRIYFANEDATYIDTQGPFFVTGPFGSTGPYYRHRYNVTWDDTIEIGIANFDYTNGVNTSNTPIYTRSRQRTEQIRVYTLGTTNPPDVVFDPDNIFTIFFGEVAPRTYWSGPFNAVFSSVQDAYYYVAGFRIRETEPGVFNDVPLQDYVTLIINDNTVFDLEYTPSNPVKYPTFYTCSYVHDIVEEPGYAHAMVTYKADNGGTYRVAGYDAGGGEVFNQELPNFGVIRSVCDGWVWLSTAIDISVMIPPDGRDWSGATTTETDDYIGNWMVRLDGEEWEPFRIEHTATLWEYFSAIQHPDALTLFNNTRLTSYDLVKTVSHPYGPPDTTYGSTPPT